MKPANDVALRLCVSVLLLALSALGAQAQDSWKTNLEAGDKAYQQRRYGEAEIRFAAALKVAEGFGPEDPRLALTLYKSAEVYFAEAKYAAALPLQQRALAIREKALGAEHADVAESLNSLAVLHQALGDYDEAEPLYQRSITISRSALGPEHPSVAIRLGNLASLYRQQGKDAAAEPLFQQSLSILATAPGTQKYFVGVVSRNLGQIYFAQGRYVDAIPLLWRGLDRAAQTLVEFVVALFLFFIVLSIALVLNSKLIAREPSSRPFRWGYFFAIYYCGIMSAAFVADTVTEYGPSQIAIESGVAVWLSIVAFACYPIIKRYRWGWIVGTIVSLNFVIWIVNYFYGKHRWSELKQGSPFRRNS